MVEKVAGFVPARISPADLESRIAHDARPSAPPDGGFAGALQQATGTLQFSAHAQGRLRARSIELSPQDTAQLSQAVELAHAKGAQESLILFEDLALIVSIRNRTVITALERGDERAAVFTHIDSAVVLPGARP